MIAFCPHCGEDIGVDLYYLWVEDAWTHCEDIECTMCGRRFVADVEMEPVFRLQKGRRRCDG